MVGYEAKRYGSRGIPLLVRRGGRDMKKMLRSLLVGADGVVGLKSYDGVSDHPVCGAKVGCAEIFLMPQPPFLTRRGMRLAHAVICSLLLCLAACARTAKPDSATSRTFKLGITSGAQEFVDFVMEGHGLLDQVGLK